MQTNISSANRGPSPALIDLAEALESSFVELGVERDDRFDSRVSFAAFVTAVQLERANPEDTERVSAEIANALLTDPENLMVFALLISFKCKSKVGPLDELRDMLDAVWSDLDSAAGVRPAGPSPTSRILVFFGLGLAVSNLAPDAADLINQRLEKRD